MNKDEMRQTLADLIEETIPGASLDEVEPDENFREVLDIDSFDFLKLMQGLERKTGITVPESDYGKLGTVEEALEYLSSC